MVTDVFTDGDSYTDPYFGAKIELQVYTATAGNCDVTVTYTNQDGTTGRTGTVTIPGGSIVGESFAVVLQAGDYGVTDVTNVTTVGGTAGDFYVRGVVVVFVEQMTTSSQTYHQITSRESIIIGAGETVDLGIRSGQKAAVTRYIHVLGQLRSIVGG